MRMKPLFVLMMLLSFNVGAWERDHAPAFKMNAAKMKEISAESVTNFVKYAIVKDWSEYFTKEYLDSPDNSFFTSSTGGVIDLNEDGVDDFVFSIPWNSCGISGAMSYVYFIVSDSKGGWWETRISGYYVEMSDLVTISGKVYFRASDLWEHKFEKSNHNHWLYQIFAFDKNGSIRVANDKVGFSFPAVTIFYYAPKFKQIELTENDRKEIARRTAIELGKTKFLGPIPKLKSGNM